jgi:5-formyltetrahydrofolate cyclo-ligase
VSDFGKIDIRAAILAARRSAPVEVRAWADAALCQTLSALVRRQPVGTVAAYRPLRVEPGGPGLLDVFAGLRVLLPVLCDDRDLDWAEPGGPLLGRSAVAGAGLVVVPAVAVDRTGVRLGRGGGSYDRALARVTGNTQVVALLYDGELVERLPAEPHDRRVSAVITPTLGIVDLPTEAGRTGLA